MAERVEIWADLHVATDKAEQEMQNWSAKTFKGGGVGGLATSPKKIISAMSGQSGSGPLGSAADEFKRQQKIRGYQERIALDRMKERREMNLDRAKFMKDATFAMMPLFNPTSVWGNLFASRQIFSAFSGTKTGQGIMGKVGLSGTGGAALAAGGTVGGLLAVGLAIKALTKTMQGMLKAYQEAGVSYAKSLTSGLGIGFVTKRSMLSQIIGVSETDVVKFGAAMKYLNPQIEWASGILAKTNANLTSVGWSFKVIGYDLQAMFSTIANDAAPAIRKFTDGISEFIKQLTDEYNKRKFLVKNEALMALSALTPGNPTWIARLFMSKGKDSGAAPMAQSWMKQMPASAWEHMGLVIGGGGMSPAQQTAHNTKRAADVLSRIENALRMQRGGAVFSPAQSYQ